MDRTSLFIQAFWLGYFLQCLVGTMFSIQYHFVNELKTWTEAQTYCREHYTDLATIDNQEDTDELIKTVKGDIKHVWIGLERSWQWSLGNTTFPREGEMEFTNWDEGAPSYGSSSEDCVVIKGNGKWNNKACLEQKPSVCYDGRNVSSERYIVINQLKPWTEAQSYCRENHTDLVSVRNQTENEWIKSSMKGTTEAWIGLFRGSWKWSDQSNSSFTNWASGQPDNRGGIENCAAMQGIGPDVGQWHDFSCAGEKPFVCYENKLILINKTVTWSEALNYCREHHVDLVSVHSEKIQNWVIKRVEKASTAHVWLGLRYSCTLGSWFWVRGESLCYQNWASGNGTGVEECGNQIITGAVESGGNKEWISFSDTERLNFICTKYEVNGLLLGHSATVVLCVSQYEHCDLCV
ncbi:macrophage mannose receptor 1-like [Chanos chanos]|uniref:Macrophage mannose receptor 1-like n=1 Tax=Chanos chanos TaxID=29144 RepID=A0A6J2VU41_CHACN|nr:macrophage mannose receptor 1-like [Chanos chanos]